MNQAPTGDPDDNLWKWIMLAALLVLLLVKAPLLKAITDKQIARIDSLEDPRVWNFYSPLGLLCLGVGIPLVKVLELRTAYSYASRIVFAASGSAVGLLLGVCGVIVLARVYQEWGTEENQALDTKLLDKAAQSIV
ncbi:hypothetical protein TeGR_g8150 [Tetraparma gracilis]|uniref:Uncharacterized protein n=1 Tax=Tetraparma gracilis TaxID=2962635 RepID=A0ABQ6N748_9STRA|nr:hypothetical protein TeGR_g8150 [Tetraparma gracilis]